jgi:hypothetical protein
LRGDDRFDSRVADRTRVRELNSDGDVDDGATGMTTMPSFVLRMK